VGYCLWTFFILDELAVLEKHACCLSTKGVASDLESGRVFGYAEGKSEGMYACGAQPQVESAAPAEAIRKRPP